MDPDHAVQASFAPHVAALPSSFSAAELRRIIGEPMKAADP